MQGARRAEGLPLVVSVAARAEDLGVAKEVVVLEAAREVEGRGVEVLAADKEAADAADLAVVREEVLAAGRAAVGAADRVEAGKVEVLALAVAVGLAAVEDLAAAERPVDSVKVVAEVLEAVLGQEVEAQVDLGRAAVVASEGKQTMKRNAFTLIELMLALSLIVVATALIGNLMQLYSRNFATRGEDIRRMQLARSILNMIAEDLRAVVTKQEYDPSVLEQQLGGGGGGGAASGGGSPAGGGTAMGGGGQTAASSAAAGGQTAAATGSDGLATSLLVARDPGLYGSQYQLTLDVSRLPRVDEYIPQGAAMVSPTLTDVPGDIKTVSYFVQTPSTMGVSDSLNAFADGSEMLTGTSGLVRRQLDRAILAYAEEVGDTQRLQQTGELIAPEVVSLEFAYYDGVQWLYEWDSTTQALPHLITITLAIQSGSGEESAAMDAGVALSTLTLDQRQAYGIELYELTVAIPGAQLRAADAAAVDAAAGMESMGL